jgi:tRNA(Arg) A34 adenosine deaminase TadA
VLRHATERLNQMSEADKADLTLYTTFEPWLMCLSAICSEKVVQKKFS